MQSEQRGPARGRPDARSTTVLRTAALVAAVFGGLTIWSGGRALFGAGDVGAAVPFVLWFNFLAGFLYLVAGYGLWRLHRWASLLALAIAICTALVFMAFGVHVAAGGAFEIRTVIAMTLRTAAWGAIAALSGWLLMRRSAERDFTAPPQRTSGKN
jgi:hypothetical protein